MSLSMNSSCCSIASSRPVEEGADLANQSSERSLAQSASSASSAVRGHALAGCRHISPCHYRTGSLKMPGFS